MTNLNDFSDDGQRVAKPRKAGLDKPVFPFGKHKGEAVDDVCHEDPGYVRWFLENVEAGDELWRSVREAALRAGVEVE